jgi:hypothetical protein
MQIAVTREGMLSRLKRNAGISDLSSSFFFFEAETVIVCRQHM